MRCDCHSGWCGLSAPCLCGAWHFVTSQRCTECSFSRITWLRYLPRTLLKHDFQLSDPLSGVLSGNECFLKMQMPLAEGKQVRELDSDHFSFSTSLLFVASPLQGILTGTDKPLYGMNWIGFLLSKVWSCSMVEIKDFIHCPSARLSLSAQFSAFRVAVSHLCL